MMATLTGLSLLNTAVAIGQPAAGSDLFAMAGHDIVTAPEHLGVNNGKLAIGTPGDLAGRIDGLWAPPFVSSDFAVRVEVCGREVPAPVIRWWPYQLEQGGSVDGLHVLTTIALAPGQRAGLLWIQLRSSASNRIEVPLVFKTGGTLDRCDFWEFSQPRSTTVPKRVFTNGALALVAGDRSLVLRGTDDGVVWDAASGTGSRTAAIEPGGTAAAGLAFAMGPAAEAAAACQAIAADPTAMRVEAEAAHGRQVADLFRRIPRLTCADPAVEAFYNRSLLALILNRWDVPEFVLRPYYSTGSIRGGCVTEYLWNYGESMLVLPLWDPAAHREHIRQFLKCDMTAHFAFNPVDGKAHGPWYMVNQEKLIGLVHHHVRITGETGFLQERVAGRTIIDHVLESALHGDDLSKPVALIDYGPSNSHLELRRQYRYHHTMPDLNGRRYANYLLAARLAEVAGRPASAPLLRERAAALKSLLSQKLWNPQTRWFDFINAQGERETRWTVQMFYLLGSGVLDEATQAGLVSHLNDREFLGEHGLHSLARNDPAYDPADVDNGGPGACTSFPPNIALLLDQAGCPHEANDLMRRCVWWGSRLPYWGDSIYADRVDYRRDTPLQSTLDAVAVAGFFIYGMFGVDPQFDGSVLVHPRPAAWAPRAALRGVRIRDAVFAIELGEGEFKVLSGGQSLAAPIGRGIRIQRNGSITLQ
ncbi:MAG TPA: hypothetical protein PKM73_10875 [Verrucomicrobiota bacterium]|nr:hypothetical protein [Verrucomicrobiota bacterium]